MTRELSISDAMAEVQQAMGPVCSKLRRRFDPAFLAAALLEQAVLTLIEDGSMDRKQAMSALVRIAKQTPLPGERRT